MGHFSFPEKLIPLTIKNALNNKSIKVYGNSNQIRDWIYVEDHVHGLYTVLTKGKISETYNIGGHNERRNIDIVNKICEILDQLVPKKKNYSELITFVEDRPGHDKRYAIDASKIQNELGWHPKETFETGITKTIDWYINNKKMLKNKLEIIKVEGD